MRNLFFLFCGGLLWASAAFAVSRVGGGTLRNIEEGLQSLDIPAHFQQNDAVDAHDNVQLPGPIMIGGPIGGGVNPQLINIYLLRNQLPDLDGVTDRSIFEQYLLSRNWIKVATTDPCLEVFELPTGSTFNMAVGWGGRGLILAGPRTGDVTSGIVSAVSSIVLTPGACGWK